MSSRIVERKTIDLPQVPRPLPRVWLGRLKGRLQSDKLFELALYASASMFALLVLLVPFYLFMRAGSAWEEAWQTLTRSTTLRVLGNTVILAVTVTVSATVLGVPLAWLTTRTDLPGRRLWAVAHALPLVIPSYIYAFLFVSFLSPKGLLQQLVAEPLGLTRLPSIYGFGGAFVVLTLISYPFIFLTTQAALRHMDLTLLEVAQTNGASKRQIARYVLLPYLKPAITSGGLLVALYCLRDFGAVSLLQFSTFTRVIYTRYQGFRMGEAATLAIVLVLMTAVVLFFESRMRCDDAQAPLEVADSAALKRIALKRWRWPSLVFTGLVAFFALIMPAIVLLYWVGRGLRQDWLVPSANQIQQNSAVLIDLVAPARTSLLTAVAAALIAVALAIPIAILATRNRGLVSGLIERISYASFALPGIVVALAFVYAGIHFFQPLYQTLPLLLAAYMVLFVPQAISAGRSSLSRIPVELEEAGYSMGGSRLAILRYVTLPLMKPGIVAGGLLVFLTVMKELPATLLLSPLGYSTLPTLIWSNLTEAFFARAAVPTLLLLLLSSVPLAWFSLRDNRDT